MIPPNQNQKPLKKPMLLLIYYLYIYITLYGVLKIVPLEYLMFTEA